MPQVLKEVEQRIKNLETKKRNEENEDKKRDIQNEITRLQGSIGNIQNIRLPTHKQGRRVHITRQ